MAGWQGHFFDIVGIPGRDNQSSRIGVVPNTADHVAHLIDCRTVPAWPGAPLGTVDGSEIAIRVGPVVPDPDPVFLQVADIGVAGKKPQKFMDDRLHMQFFRRQEREPGGQDQTASGGQRSIGYRPPCGHPGRRRFRESGLRGPDIAAPASSRRTDKTRHDADHACQSTRPGNRTTGRITDRASASQRPACPYGVDGGSAARGSC